MDNYSRIALIGVGSFGRVFKAIDKTTAATVALKIIAKRGRTVKEITNLRGECQIQEHLRHPNIIRMLHSFETADEIVVVTEYAQSDLHKLLIRERSIPEERARRLTYDLVSALYYLHSHRILHRDLKPQNVLLDAGERAKLCDFGLARNMTMGTHVLTSIKGTPLYMAPELMSEKPYDHQADLWSLGCIVFEMMTGATPFSTTSFVRLVMIIRHEPVRWPSFLSADCVSFLKGLLEKDPTERLSWTAILQHPFVAGHVMAGDTHTRPGAPLTHPLSRTLSLEKEKQLNDLTNMVARYRPLVGDAQIPPNAMLRGTELHSSQDSIHAILQSDIEPLETDVEDGGAGSGAMCVADGQPLQPQPIADPGAALVPLGYDFSNLCFVTGNANLIVNNFVDNFQLPIQLAQQHLPAQLQAAQPLVPLQLQQLQQPRVSELELRKLSQNLENFSVRQSQSATTRNPGATDASQPVAVSGNSTTPPPRAGWDSSADRSTAPPIETDEWLHFLHRSMQEVLDGEWDALCQQNLVSIVVAPLRNAKASARVVECVAQLLSLPLVLPATAAQEREEVAAIREVYYAVKLVPNLVYASKLMCASSAGEGYRGGAQLREEERAALLAVYELIAHLVHLGERYLTQFCDAVAILGAGQLLARLLPTDNASGGHPDAVRLASALLGVLCCALREQPENAELIEQIVLPRRRGELARWLAAVRNAQLRERWSRMLRMLGRFSCRALQGVWTAEVRAVVEGWREVGGEQERREAELALKEFMHMPFYYQTEA